MKIETKTEEEKKKYIILKSQEIVNCILDDLKKKVCLKRYDKLNMKVRGLLIEEQQRVKPIGKQNTEFKKELLNKLENKGFLTFQ